MIFAAAGEIVAWPAGRSLDAVQNDCRVGTRLGGYLLRRWDPTLALVGGAVLHACQFKCPILRWRWA